MRDYMNDGGKVLVAGQAALQGALGPVPLQPARAAPPKPFCKSNQTAGNGDADDPVGQNLNCVVVSNDFLQYWLGAYLPITLSDDPADDRRRSRCSSGPFGTAPFTLNGDGLGGQPGQPRTRS